MDRLNIIVPSYNEQDVLEKFYSRIKDVMVHLENVSYKIIFVDDGSKDKTLELIKKMAAGNQNIKYVSFSRNFGKEAAIFSGLEFSKRLGADLIVLLDADLQDPPELILKMYEQISQNNYEVVAARRVSRKGEPKLKSFLSDKFYDLINKLSNTRIENGARDFRMMKSYVVDSILSLREYNRFSKGLFAWVGFKTKYLEYENVERIAGNTKWSMWKLFLYAFDGIIAFSTVPLAISSFVGFVMFFVSILWAFYIAIKTILFGDPVAGFPTLSCLILFIGSIQLFSVGILGQYLSKVYSEVKHRPIYICKETNIN